MSLEKKIIIEGLQKCFPIIQAGMGAYISGYLLAVAAQKAGLQYDQVGSIVAESKKLTLLKSLDGLSVFEFGGNINDSSIYSAKNLPSAGPLVAVTDYDSSFYDLGFYISEEFPSYYYPYLDLSTQVGTYEKSWNLYEDENHFILEYSLPFDTDLYRLEITESTQRARVFDGISINYFDFEVENEITEGILRTKIKKESIDYIDLTKTEVENCFNEKDTLGLDIGLIGLTVVSSDGAVACFGYGRPLLALWNGYLLRVESENVSGRPLFFYAVAGKSRDQSKVEKFLDRPFDYFIFKPGYYYDDGYGFGFQNLSYQGVKSENRLKDISIYLFPYDVLKSIRFVKKEFTGGSSIASVGFRKYNYSIYKLDEFVSESNTIILNQAYDPGWIALCGVKICKAKHVEVSNWSNGWVFEENIPEGVTLVFWPQLLQYLGYLVFIGTLFVVTVRKKAYNNTLNN